MARYLRDCTQFILESGDTAEEQIAAFAALQAQSPRKFRDLTDFLFLSPRARALVKPKVFARYLDDTQKMSQDRVTEVLLCGSDNDCRSLLKGAKESSRQGLIDFLSKDLVAGFTFKQPRKYPDINRCVLVLLNTSAADYVKAEAFFAKWHKKDPTVFWSSFRKEVGFAIDPKVCAQLQQLYSETAKTNGVSPSGEYCPVCGAPMQVRERRMDGDTTCINGHTTATSMWSSDPDNIKQALNSYRYSTSTSYRPTGINDGVFKQTGMNSGELFMPYKFTPQQLADYNLLEFVPVETIVNAFVEKHGGFSNVPDAGLPKAVEALYRENRWSMVDPLPTKVISAIIALSKLEPKEIDPLFSEFVKSGWNYDPVTNTVTAKFYGADVCVEKDELTGYLLRYDSQGERSREGFPKVTSYPDAVQYADAAVLKTFLNRLQLDLQALGWKVFSNDTRVPMPLSFVLAQTAVKATTFDVAYESANAQLVTHSSGQNLDVIPLDKRRAYDTMELAMRIDHLTAKPVPLTMRSVNVEGVSYALLRTIGTDTTYELAVTDSSGRTVQPVNDMGYIKRHLDALDEYKKTGKRATFVRDKVQDYSGIVPGYVTFSKVLDGKDIVGAVFGLPNVKSAGCVKGYVATDWGTTTYPADVFEKFNTNGTELTYEGRATEISLTDKSYGEFSVFKRGDDFYYLNAVLHSVVLSAMSEAPDERYYLGENYISIYDDRRHLGAIALVRNEIIDNMLEESYASSTTTQASDIAEMSPSEKARVFVNDSELLKQYSHIDGVLTKADFRTLINTARAEFTAHGEQVAKRGVYQDVSEESLNAFSRKFLALLNDYKVDPYLAKSLLSSVSTERVSLSEILAAAKKSGVIGVPNPKQVKLVARFSDNSNRETKVLELHGENTNAALLVSGGNVVPYSSLLSLYEANYRGFLDKRQVEGVELNAYVRATVQPTPLDTRYFMNPAKSGFDNFSQMKAIVAVIDKSTSGLFALGSAEDALPTEPDAFEKCTFREVYDVTDTSAEYEDWMLEWMKRPNSFVLFPVTEPALRYYLAALRQDTYWWEAPIYECTEEALKPVDFLQVLRLLSQVEVSLFAQGSSYTPDDIAKNTFYVPSVTGEQVRVRKLAGAYCNGSQVLMQTKGNGSAYIYPIILVHIKNGVYMEHAMPQLEREYRAAGSLTEQDTVAVSSPQWMRFVRVVARAGGFLPYCKLLAASLLGNTGSLSKNLNTLLGNEAEWSRAANNTVADREKQRVQNAVLEKEAADRAEAQSREEVENATKDFLQGKQVDAKYFEKLMYVHNIETHPRTLGWIRNNLHSFSTGNVQVQHGAKVPDSFWELRDKLAQAVVELHDMESYLDNLPTKTK